MEDWFVVWGVNWWWFCSIIFSPAPSAAVNSLPSDFLFLYNPPTHTLFPLQSEQTQGQNVVCSSGVAWGAVFLAAKLRFDEYEYICIFVCVCDFMVMFVYVYICIYILYIYMNLNI